MSPRGKEKRSHPRLSEKLTLRTISAGEFGTIEMETANLSLGGAYCLSDRDIEPMTQIRLSIFLPSTDGRPAQLHYPIEVDAVVVRSDLVNGSAPPGDGPMAYRLALFFSRIADKDRQLLASYLEAGKDS